MSLFLAKRRERFVVGMAGFQRESSIAHGNVNSGVDVCCLLWTIARNTPGFCFGKAADDSDDAVSVLERCDQVNLECESVHQQNQAWAKS